MSKNKKLLEFENITSNIIKKLGVQALADRPNAAGKYGNAGMSAAQLKAWFDQLAEFLANKINTIQDTFASEDIASYIRLTLDEYDVEHLQDLIDAILDGSFAEKLLMVLPTQTDTERVTLQSAIFKINKNIADQIASVRKQITDLGYGYTDADVRFIEDGGEVGADVEAVDDNGSRVLIFTFRNFGKGAIEAALDFPIVGGTAKNSIVHKTDGDVENKAITENSVAFGEGNIAGAKGYYFTEIFYGKASINPQIKVSAVQPKDMGLYISPEPLSSNPIFEAPTYAVGDVFSLICNDHFILFGTITDISHDIISFKGDLEVFKSGLESMVAQGIGKMAGDYYINLVPNYDDYTLCVPNKPLNGIVEVCKNAFASGCGNISAGEEGTAHGGSTKVVGAYGHTSGLGTLAGYASSAEGSGSQAPAKYSHAENMNTKATGLASHAEGLATTSSGQFSHSEGTSTTAKGDASHAEGRTTQSLANGSHSEGGYTTAQGSFSHAEGASTIAKGTASHAGGYHTIASANYQYVTGMFNKVNPDALFIIGNGASEEKRSNAFEVLKDGRVNVPFSNISKIAIGEFCYNGEEITLHFDFTPCAVFVQSGTTTSPIVSPLPTASVQTFMYDPDTMKDNSWTAKYLGEKQKICRYCAVGIDSVSFEPVVIPETSITVYRVFDNGKPDNTPQISETFVISSPKITLRNYRDSGTGTGGNTYYINAWEMSVNGGDYEFVVQSSSKTNGSKLVLSPNINSDGSSPDDFVIQSSYPNTSYTTIELEEGKNYVLYAQQMS